MRIHSDPAAGTLSGSHSILFIRLFGLPFFLVGLAVMAAWFGAFEIEVEGGGELGLGTALTFFLVFGGLGLAAMTHGRGFLIDTQAGTVICWRRVLLRFGKQRKLSAFDEVRLLRRVVEGDRSSQTVFPVQLAKTGGRAELDLMTPGDFFRARQLAEATARLLQLPMLDDSGDEPERREAAELDKSLRQRQRETDQAPTLPELHKSKRLSLELDGDKACLVIQRPGLDTAHVLALMFALGGIAFVAVPLAFMLVDSEPFFQIVVPLVFVSPAAGLFCFAVQHAQRGWRLEIDKQTLLVKHTGFPSRQDRFDIGEIEALLSDGKQNRGNPIMALARHRAVAICSDQKLVHVGGGLGKQDSAYLRSFLEALLAAPGH